MVESTAVFLHTSSHPDKHNNSVDRIISKKEEREDPRRELQSIFEYSGVSTNNTRTTRTTVFLHAVQQLSSSQHLHNPYRSSQAHSYRILPGEIGFFPKGLSIVCPCNTKVSVFQFTCYKNINSIQSSNNSM